MVESYVWITLVQLGVQPGDKGLSITAAHRGGADGKRSGHQVVLLPFFALDGSIPLPSCSRRRLTRRIRAEKAHSFTAPGGIAIPILVRDFLRAYALALALAPGQRPHQIAREAARRLAAQQPGGGVRGQLVTLD